MKAIIASEKDPAGMNIFHSLLNKGFESTDRRWLNKTVYRKNNWLLARAESEIVYANEVADLDVDEVIFISKHASKSGEPTLTTHVPGNFGPADYGGNPGKLCSVRADRMREVHLQLLNPPFDYKVSLEVTHHGPYIPQPCFFVELGSTEEQWEQEEPGEYIAKAVNKAIEKEPREMETAIGIGGNHYAPKFSEAEEDIAIGHIIPRYAQDHLDKDMVEQMIEKTLPEPSKILIDKKGTKQQSKVREMLSEYEVDLL